MSDLLDEGLVNDDDLRTGCNMGPTQLKQFRAAVRAPCAQFSLNAVLSVFAVSFVQLCCS